MSAESEGRPSSAGHEPKPIKLKPSRNQKQRSKLKQSPEVAAPAAPATPADAVTAPPAATPPPPPPPPAQEEALLRRMRLKRSGQMHEDVLSQPPAPHQPEDEY